MATSNNPKPQPPLAAPLILPQQEKKNKERLGLLLAAVCSTGLHLILLQPGEGVGLIKPPRPGSFDGRGSATREAALRMGGGTKESEAAVVRGLQWLLRVQSPDGRWSLDNPSFNNPSKINDDVAGTAFGLLPLLGAGKTHKPKDHPYDKPIGKALLFLVRRQNKQNGHLGSDSMYGHALATIALCEAYGLSQDFNLRKPAQMAVGYIIYAQHDAGGWRYQPKQAGDTSVTGWQVMALKSAQMAGLDVPDLTMQKGDPLPGFLHFL